MASFTTGFLSVTQFLLLISGGFAAVAMFLAAVLLVVCLAGVIFDGVTQSMAKRWECKGKQPKGKFGRILLEHYRRQRE